MKEIKYIEKLRLLKGKKYILFVSSDNMDNQTIINLSKAIDDFGAEALIVQTKTNKGIKVVEE